MKIWQKLVLFLICFPCFVGLGSYAFLRGGYELGLVKNEVSVIALPYLLVFFYLVGLVFFYLLKWWLRELRK